MLNNDIRKQQERDLALSQSSKAKESLEKKVAEVSELNKEIKLFNKGDMVRDFTYVDDIIESIIRLVNMDNTDEKCDKYHEVFNLGSGKPIKLIDYLSIIEKEIGKKALIKYLPMQKGDIKKTFADSKKLKEFLGFSPRTGVNEGIKYFIQWYKKYYIL